MILLILPTALNIYAWLGFYFQNLSHSRRESGSRTDSLTCAGPAHVHSPISDCSAAKTRYTPDRLRVQCEETMHLPAPSSATTAHLPQ